MAWKSKRGKWDWRAYLTPEEAVAIKSADADRAEIVRMEKAWRKKHGAARQMILNRAIQRAKYDTKPTGPITTPNGQD